MEPQQTPSSVPPTQSSGVMVDLLHPQEVDTSQPAAAEPQTTPVAPVVPAPSIVGTTQAPRPRKPFPVKAILFTLMLILMLGGIGAGVYFYFFHKTPTVAVQAVGLTPGPVAELNQMVGTTTLATGAATNQSTLMLGFSFANSATSGSLIPEVEIQPVGTPFTGTPTISGNSVNATGHSLQLSVLAANLKDGSYHWQARVNVAGTPGPWQVYDAMAANFIIDTTAPTAPVVSSVGGATVASGRASTTVARPLFAGTADPNTAINVTVKPEGLSYGTTASTTGSWSLTPSDDIPNGDHTVIITAKDAAGNISTTTISLASNPVATTSAASPVAPTASSTLAPTGDPVVPVSLLAILLLTISLAGLWSVSRRHGS